MHTAGLFIRWLLATVLALSGVVGTAAFAGHGGMEMADDCGPVAMEMAAAHDHDAAADPSDCGSSQNQCLKLHCAQTQAAILPSVAVTAAARPTPDSAPQQSAYSVTPLPAFRPPRA